MGTDGNLTYNWMFPDFPANRSFSGSVPRLIHKICRYFESSSLILQTFKQRNGRVYEKGIKKTYFFLFFFVFISNIFIFILSFVFICLRFYFNCQQVEKSVRMKPFFLSFNYLFLKCHVAL